MNTQELKFIAEKIKYHEAQGADARQRRDSYAAALHTGYKQAYMVVFAEFAVTE